MAGVIQIGDEIQDGNVSGCNYLILNGEVIDFDAAEIWKYGKNDNYIMSKRADVSDKLIRLKISEFIEQFRVVMADMKCPNYPYMNRVSLDNNDFGVRIEHEFPYLTWKEPYSVDEYCLEIVDQFNSLPFQNVLASYKGSTPLTVHIDGSQDYRERTIHDIIKDVLAALPDVHQNAVSNLSSVTSESEGVFRSIVFPPEYRQAGLSILNYFGRIVEQKYPDDEVKIRIEQDGNRVTLHVETQDGAIEKIEKTLDDYALVVKGQMPPEALLDNPLQLMELNFRLQTTKTELDMSRQLLAMSEKNNHGRIESLEDQIQFLNDVVGEGLRSNAKNQDLLQLLIEANQLDAEVSASIQLIREKVEAGLSDADKKEIISALTTVREKDESLFSKIESFAFSCATGTSSNLLANWIAEILKALPK